MVKDFITNIVKSKQSLVYKSPKKGQTSFRLTKQLLQSIWLKAEKLNTLPVLILSIPANLTENYVVRCAITKEKK